MGAKSERLKGKITAGAMDLYGYNYHKGTGARTINPQDGEVVRMVFHWLADDDTMGESFGQVRLQPRCSR